MVTQVHIRFKQAYEPPSKLDGTRVLIDPLWPCGVTKQEATIDHWFRDLAPSTELRKWFGHYLARWDQFRQRYTAELKQHTEQLDELLRRSRRALLISKLRNSPKIVSRAANSSASTHRTTGTW